MNSVFQLKNPDGVEISHILDMLHPRRNLKEEERMYIGKRVIIPLFEKEEVENTSFSFPKLFSLFCSFLGRYFSIQRSSIKFLISFILPTEERKKEQISRKEDFLRFARIAVLKFTQNISFHDILSEFEEIINSKEEDGIMYLKEVLSKEILTTKDINIGVFSKCQFEIIRNDQDFHFDLCLVHHEDEVMMFSSESCFLDPNFFPRMCDNFVVFTKSIIQSPDSPIVQLEFLSTEEHDLQISINSTSSTSYLSSNSLKQAIEQTCTKFSDLTSVEYLSEALSYKDLDEKSNILARYILRNSKIKTGDYLGISFEKSTELIICIITCFKLSCVYFPIEPSFPSERIRFLLEDTRCKFVLTSENLMLTKFSKICKDETISLIPINKDFFLSTRVNENERIFPDEKVSGNSICYISYTSGSSGEPKGVLHENTGALNVYNQLQSRLGMRPGDRILFFSSISFDEHLNSLMSGLLSGSTVVICPEDTRYDPESLWNFVNKRMISILKLTPSVLCSLPQKQVPEHLLCVSIIGEVCPQSVMEFWADNVKRFVHLYGSQETILDHSKLWKSSDHPGNVGKLFANYQCFILDSFSFKPVPLGIPGELFIVGPSISRGYLNMPELTSEIFLKCPFIEDKMMYRTDDIALVLSNGDLVFSGRSRNGMVKLNGMRVEIGEIEQNILRSGFVSRVFVNVKHIKGSLSDRKILVAFIIPKNEICKANETVPNIKKYLEEILPHYMIPHLFITKYTFPYTSSGKLDFRRLLDFDVSKYFKENYVAPRTEEEKKMQNIFEEILGRSELEEKIGIFDDFYVIGGTSLSLILLKRKIEKTFLIDVDFSFLFQLVETTIKELCHLLFYNEETTTSKNEELNEDLRDFLRDFDEEGMVLDMSNGESGILYRYMEERDLEECVELDIRAWHFSNPLYIHTGISEEEDRFVTPLFLKASIHEQLGLVAINPITDKIIMINSGYSNKAVEDCNQQIPDEISSNSPNRPIGALYEICEKNIPKKYLIEPILNAGSLAKSFNKEDISGISIPDVYFKLELLLHLVGKKKGYNTFLDDPNNPLTQEHARILASNKNNNCVIHEGVKFDTFEFPERSGEFPLKGMKEGYVNFLKKHYGEAKAREVESIKFDILFYCTRDWRKKDFFFLRKK